MTADKDVQEIKAEVLFVDYGLIRAGVYEYEGRKFVINFKGGICAIPAESKEG